MELKALLIQGEPDKRKYRLFTEDARGREKWRDIDGAAFWRIQEAAGPADYTEPGYWSYENRAIEWDDVFESRGI